MQALRVNELSDDLSGASLVDVPAPERQPGEVLMRVRAASLNYPDLLMMSGRYQFKPPPPFLAGMECAGEVIEADAASGFSPGDRVMGGNKTGAFAEMASLPAAALSPIPERLHFTRAAAFGAAYSTAYTGLVELGGLRDGDWALIHGASGGVGLAACDLARGLGARVIASTSSPAKEQRILDAVSPTAIIRNSGGFREEVKALTDGRLADLVFDPVGGDVFDESTRAVAFGGKIIIVGFASGRIAEVKTNIPLIKGFSIVGLRAGEYARRFPERGHAIRLEIARLIDTNAIRGPLIDRTLPLSRWREGYSAMAAGDLVGKLVFEPGA